MGFDFFICGICVIRGLVLKLHLASAVAAAIIPGIAVVALIAAPAALRLPVARVTADDFAVVVGGRVAEVHADGGRAEKDVHRNAGRPGAVDPPAAAVIPIKARAGIEINFVVGIINQATVDADNRVRINRRGGDIDWRGGDIGLAADGLNDATGHGAEEGQAQDAAEQAAMKSVASGVSGHTAIL